MQEFLRFAAAQLEAIAKGLNEEHVSLVKHRDWMVSQRNMTPMGHERQYWTDRLDEDHDIMQALHEASVDLIKAKARLDAVRSSREKSGSKARKAV